MYKFTCCLLGFLVCMFLVQCQNQKSQEVQAGPLDTAAIADDHKTVASYATIRINNDGPTGSRFTNVEGEEEGFLLFRIQIFNDTIVPIEIAVTFPIEPVVLLPDSLATVEVYVLPDSITPDTMQNAANFGVIGIADFFNSELTDPGKLNAIIQPKEHHTLYVGMLPKGNMGSGSYKAKLFFDGQDIDAPFLPVRSIETERTDDSALDLIFGIAYTPHQQYILIPCGHITFME